MLSLSIRALVISLRQAQTDTIAKQQYACDLNHLTKNSVDFLQKIVHLDL